MLVKKIEKKIKTHAELAKTIKKHRNAGKKIVLYHGVLDFIHPGHVFQLNEAISHGDILVVSVVDDIFVEKGPGRPYFPERLRLEWVAAFSQVNYVTLCKSPGPWEVMKLIRPDVYIKGDDTKHLLDDPTSGVTKDKKIIESLGGKLIFTKTLPVHSPDLVQEIFVTFPFELEQFLKKFRNRYSKEKLFQILDSFKKLKVLVIGEAITDEYDYVGFLGKPSNTNVISTKYIEREEFAGGIIACANHLNDFCGEVNVLTCLGEKSSKEKFIRSHLKSKVKPIFFYGSSSRTIVKRRYVDHKYYNKFFEVCFLNDAPINSKLELTIMKWLKKNLKNYDLVIIADYGHGLLTPNLIKNISGKARFLAVNTQTNSANQGFNPITKYPRANYICLTEDEIRIALRERYKDIKKLIPKVAAKLSANIISVTKGPDGALVYSKDGKYTTVPALITKVIDPIGAGDAYLVISAMAASLGYPSDMIGFLGNIAGSIATQIVCNRSSIKISEFTKYIENLLS